MIAIHKNRVKISSNTGALQNVIFIKEGSDWKPKDNLCYEIYFSNRPTPCYYYKICLYPEKKVREISECKRGKYVYLAREDRKLTIPPAQLVTMVSIIQRLYDKFVELNLDNTEYKPYTEVSDIIHRCFYHDTFFLQWQMKRLNEIYHEINLISN